jgi:hypothetical protein
VKRRKVRKVAKVRKVRGRRRPYVFESLVIVILLATLALAAVANYRIQQSRKDIANPAPTATAEATLEEPAPLDSGALAQRQATIVAQEDSRLSVVASSVATTHYEFSDQKSPYLIAIPGQRDTVVLTPDKLVYTMDDLRSLLGTALIPQGNGAYLLTKSLAVSPGTTLALRSQDVDELRLASDPSGITTIVSFGGTLEFTGTASRPLQITSWDAAASGPDADPTDGRAYVRSLGGVFTMSYAHVADLGFWSGRTAGLALTGTNFATAGTALVTGSILDSTITGDAYGIFVTSASGITIGRVTVADSLLDGVLLHRSVTEVNVYSTTATHSGGSGFVADRGVNGVTFTSVSATSNGKDGILLDGQPLADGPSASGASIGGTGKHTVSDSTASHNAKTGIEVIGADGVNLLRNTVESNDMGIVVRAKADGVAITDNTIRSQERFGVYLREGATNATISGNEIVAGRTAIFLRDSTGTVRNNTIERASGHAISLVGGVGTSKVTDNVVGGRGTSAIDTFRADGKPLVENNDDSAWRAPSLAYAIAHWVFHPLRITWVAILVLMVLSALFGRHKRWRREHPYASMVRLAPRPALPTAGSVVAPRSSALDDPPSADEAGRSGQHSFVLTGASSNGSAATHDQS